jgi:hypothetical protein
MNVIYGALAEELAQYSVVEKALGKHRLVRLRNSVSVPDSPSIYAIGNLYVILISPTLFPNIAADEARAIKSAKVTTSAFSTMTLDIVAEGRLLDGRSFLVLPRGILVGRNRMRFAMEKRSLTRAILGWLRQLASEAAEPSDKTSAEFRASLESLAGLSDLPEEIRKATEVGLDRLSKRTFLPRHCAMHGDLWKGNIVYGPDKRPRLIDWRGSRLDGFGFFDLVKFAQSFRLDARTVQNEIDEHSRSLKIDPADVKSTFLAGCGSINRNLDHFPLRNFLAMTSSLYELLE